MNSLSITHMLNLESRAPDLDLPSVLLYQHIPWVAPEGYLHWIFKPAQPNDLDRVCTELRVPGVWRDFLKQQNGASIFNALDLDGVREANALMVRNTSDRKPFDIANSNQPRKLPPDRDWLCIGSYAYYRSRAMLDRENGQVHVVEQDTPRVIATWPSAELWLSEEVARLRLLFSEDGHLLTDKEYTDPQRAFPSA